MNNHKGDDLTHETGIEDNLLRYRTSKEKLAKKLILKMIL